MPSVEIRSNIAGKLESVESRTLWSFDLITDSI